MSEQTSVTDWADQQPTTEADADDDSPGNDTDPASQSTEQVTLFRLTNDPFVNFAAATLAVRLGDPIRTTPTAITVPQQSVEDVLRRLKATIDEAMGQTHRRSSLAHSVNAALDAMGAPGDDARRIQPPDTPFPADGAATQTIYGDDTLSPDAVEQHELAAGPLADADIDADATLFTQSPSYVGTNRSDFFPYQEERYEAAFAAFEQTATGEVTPDEKSCMCCGTAEYPAYDNPVTDDKVDYNQTFALLVSSSGQARALGGGTRHTSHRGRCVACLVAGFYFALMEKIVRQTDSNENDARIFVPTGDFDQLTRIATDLYLTDLLADIDEPVGPDRSNSRQRTLGQFRTRSLRMQALDIYQRIVKHVQAERTGGAFETELSYRPVEFVTFVSELGRVRDIKQLQRISPSAPIYDLLQLQQAGPSTGDYWPADAVVRWFAETSEGGTTGLTEAKDTLADGIINADLERVRRGVVAIGRAVERAGGTNTPGYARPHPANLHHFFTVIMQQATNGYDQIDDEAIESIQHVASALGRVFSGGDDVSVLINLQNASTQAEFLRAFEKAGMQAHKKSTEEPPERFDASRDDDVATVLRLASDSDTFEPTKRMFVIHASLAAQYANATRGQANGGDDA